MPKSVFHTFRASRWEAYTLYIDRFGFLADNGSFNTRLWAATPNIIKMALYDVQHSLSRSPQMIRADYLGRKGAS